jgi:hypothetical protein
MNVASEPEGTVTANASIERTEVLQESALLIWEWPRGTTPSCTMEVAMLFFYLPIIIFDAMLPNPKRKAGKPTAVE